MEAEYCVPKKVARKVSRPAESGQFNAEGEWVAGGMDAVWAEYDSAKSRLNRCRRVITANAALFNAQQRLRDRLAEFHSSEVDQY